MNYKDYLIIVPGQPNSIFFEIFFKTINKINIKNPIILVTSEKLIKLEMKKFNFTKKIKLINKNNLKTIKLNNNFLNIVDINYYPNKAFQKTSIKSNKYIIDCFNTAFEIIKKYKLKKFINGPINKNTFLKKKFPGITEYISSNFSVKESAMLIFNKDLSVCPLTTHIPIKNVSRSINKKQIVEKVRLIGKFYQSKFKIKPKIAILGLNPHCESIDKFNEDEKIIKPTVKYLKKQKYLIYGPYSADTIFLKQNRMKYNVILGMYHDQVLIPAKTLFEYDAINITLGLPFTRISPDHGPNETMVGKNKSNPLSLIKAISFLDTN